MAQNIEQLALNEMTEEDLAFLAKQGISLPMGMPALTNYLPHRYPFVLLDRVTAIYPNKGIVGYKNVSNNEHFFNGHFPNQPIMPGVLMIEALAQISGVLGFVSESKDLSDGAMFLFAGVDNVRFKRQVIPGDTLILQAQCVMQKRNVYKYKCHALVENQLAVSADIMLVKQAV